MSHFTHLAQQICTTNDQNAYAEMVNAICDIQSLEKLLKEIPHSEILHFTFTEILSKVIISGGFCPINETKSDSYHMNDNTCEKTKLYEMIIPNLFSTVCTGNFENKKYILRSALNAISMCLKDLCDNNKNIGVFTNILENCLFIGWKSNTYFTSCLNGELTFIHPSPSVIQYFMTEPKGLEIFKHSAKILIEFIEYVTMPTIYKSYYEYRRNIYTFRNTYLSTILNVAIEYHKFLHQEWKKNPHNLEIFNALEMSISLLEKTIAYPFSLTLHEYETDDENKDSAIGGLCSDIYFPTYYRNILCDMSFLDMIFELYFFLISELKEISQLRDTVYSLIKIQGRIVSASVYTFNSEEERKIFRSYCTNAIISMLQGFKFFDTEYIHSLCEIFNKVLSSYTAVDLLENREKFYQGLLHFCELIILNSPIKLEDGKRNAFSKAFEIIVNCITENKESDFCNFIESKSQEILNKAFYELQNSEYAEKIINEFGKNKKSEIECFEELFEHIPIVFAINLDVNLINLKSLGIEKFGESLQTIWLHLCSVLLPNNLANRSQTEIILKYFKVAENGNTMASLHYIHVLIDQVLHDMENGLPSTPLWSHIQDLEGCTFTDFTLYILKVCKKNFNQTNTEIIDYALDVFKSIYMKLKKHSSGESESVELKFDPFYNEVKELITNLPNTVFENPNFFKRRVQLFSVISTIWINPDNYRHLQEIYDLVSAKLKLEFENAKLQNRQFDFQTLLKYIHDMRGLLEPIEDFESFKIICELSIADLSSILPYVFRSQEEINALFGEENFLKAFCKMILQFVTDFGRRLTYHVQTELPFLIHDLFKPCLEQILNFDYPKCVVKIWEKFASLSPLEEMLPLNHSFKEKNPKEFPCLIKEYFDNIHRVPINELESLYPYIEDRIEFLCQWWEEMVRRKLSPSVSLKDVVESRIAVSKRQREELAKLVFFVGSYDQKYWDVKGFTDEREFVKMFLETYKTWKE